MKLYLISQTANIDDDTYAEAVVCAPDEQTARHMNLDTGLPMDWQHPSHRWCQTPEEVTVKYIGEADKSLPCGPLSIVFLTR